MIRILTLAAQLVSEAAAITVLVLLWRTRLRWAIAVWNMAIGLASLAAAVSCARAWLGRPWELFIAALWACIALALLDARRRIRSRARWIALARTHAAAPDDGRLGPLGDPPGSELRSRL